MAIFQKFISKKSTVYDDMVTLIKANGWTDVSSKPATDYNVFYSNGTDGAKNMYFQMVPWTYSSAYAPETQINYGGIQINPRGLYTPGAPGVAGAFERTTIYAVMLHRNPVPLGQQLLIWYDITKDHITFIIEEDNPTGRYGYFIHIGCLTHQLATETDGSGLMLLSNCSTMTDGTAFCNYSTLGAAGYALTSYSASIIKSKTLKGEIIMGEVGIGNTTEGLRGIMDDVYYVAEKSLIEGDTITLSDGRIFRFMSTTAGYYVSGGSGYSSTASSFPTIYFAFRVG